MVLNMIFGLITFITLIILLCYRSQVRSILYQVRYIKSQDTNKIISKYIQLKEINELTDELNDLLSTHRKKMKEFGVKDAYLKETITNISHDIRTPLTSLNGYFELLKESDNEDDRARYHSIIDTRIFCLKEILEQLFTFVKIQNDEYELELSPCNINQIICDVMFSFYDDLKQQGIEPKIILPAIIYNTIANEIALKRVLQNIIKNALDHGKDSLCIEMQNFTNEIQIAISNECEQVEDNIDVGKVFERFYKADKSRRYNSTGLGLSIAKGLVLKMNGEIEATFIDNRFTIIILLKH